MPELSINFLLPNKVESRLEQLRPFPYPDGNDIPTGKVLPNPYKLSNGAFYTGEWKVSAIILRLVKLMERGCMFCPKSHCWLV